MCRSCVNIAPFQPPPDREILSFDIGHPLPAPVFAGVRSSAKLAVSRHYYAEEFNYSSSAGERVRLDRPRIYIYVIQTTFARTQIFGEFDGKLESSRNEFLSKTRRRPALFNFCS